MNVYPYCNRLLIEIKSRNFNQKNWYPILKFEVDSSLFCLLKKPKTESAETVLSLNRQQAKNKDGHDHEHERLSSHRKFPKTLTTVQQWCDVMWAQNNDNEENTFFSEKCQLILNHDQCHLFTWNSKSIKNQHFWYYEQQQQQHQTISFLSSLKVKSDSDSMGLVVVCIVIKRKTNHELNGVNKIRYPQYLNSFFAKENSPTTPSSLYRHQHRRILPLEFVSIQFDYHYDMMLRILFVK